MVDTPAAFSIPEDIANRALQHLGVRRIVSFQDASQEARAMGFVYDKVRRAELRRNTWVFSTRRTALRPLASNNTLTASPTVTPSTGTLKLNPAVWNSGQVYTPGAIVADPTIRGLFWTSLEQENVGNAPGPSSPWDVWYGSPVVTPYDPTLGYWAGELVYITDPNTQAVNVYRSLVNGAGQGDINTTVGGNPVTLTEWSPTVTYNRDQVVTYEFYLYRSATEQNTGNIPVGNATWIPSSPLLAANINWLPIQAGVQSYIAAYPIGAGPVQEANTRNAFVLPNGYLRMAPQDPTQGGVSYLGAPGGLTYSDWVIEAGFLTSRESNVILLRFIADITNVARMDDMFCEGLAARMAMETCEELTQSGEKWQKANAEYRLVMGEARIVNAIESGTDQPPEDDYISCRM